MLEQNICNVAKFVVLILHFRTFDSSDVNKSSGFNDTSEVNHSLSINRRNMEGFIVGGNEASIDMFPHSVFLTCFCQPKQEQYWICGSSILNQRIVLTAAHCVYGCLGNFHIDVIAGTANVEYVNVLRKVQRYVYHGKYDPQTDFCDIAVCLLNGNLPLGRKIQRVIIKNYFPIGTTGEVAGWGVISESYAESPKLKKVKQVVRPSDHCSHLKLRAGMMCVSSGSQSDYPAVGDSGSALVTNAYQQIGIVSFKSKSKKASTIVYTNVSFFYDWIQYQSKRLWCSARKL